MLEERLDIVRLLAVRWQQRQRLEKPLEGREVTQAELGQLFSIEAKHLDGHARSWMIVDRERHLLAEGDERARFLVHWMDQHRLFCREIVQVAARAPGRVGEREQVLLEALIAELTGEKQVLPGISEPEVTRLLQGIAIVLPHAAFRTVVLDVTVSYVPDFGFTKGALSMLNLDQGVLH